MPDDLAEVIARLAPLLTSNVPDRERFMIDRYDLHVLLDAAEAGIKARDAALEEATAIADRIDTKEKPGWQVAEEIEIAIRALKEKL